MDQGTSRLLMDNERNLVLYLFLGLVLIILSITLPRKLVFFPAVLTGILTGVIFSLNGVFVYIKRRKSFIGV